MLQLLITLAGYIVAFAFGFAYCKRKYTSNALFIGQLAKRSIEKCGTSIRDIEFYYYSGISVGAAMSFDQEPQLPDLKKILEGKAKKENNNA